MVYNEYVGTGHISLCSLHELIEYKMPPKITQSEFPMNSSFQSRGSQSPIQQSCNIEEVAAASVCANEPVASDVHEGSHDSTSMSLENSISPSSVATLKPYPYFFYRDFSTVPDPDPLIPLTGPGCMPRFLAKMHSILTRDDLSHIISWMPHGRSWRVLKPDEFEKTVIPTYFQHAKISSFMRQANGWGFRRITHGRDRNTYYHDMFLRGLPHLCKMMKRPRVSVKHVTDPEHEPDFYKISEERPVPMKPADESILLHCTLQGGPKARMPVYQGNLSKRPTFFSVTIPSTSPSNMAQLPQSLTMNVAPAVGTSYPYPVAPGASGTSESSSQTAVVQQAPSQEQEPSLPGASFHVPVHEPVNSNQRRVLHMWAPIDSSSNVAANHGDTQAALSLQAQNAAAAAANQFAAGFAVAVALSQQRFPLFSP